MRLNSLILAASAIIVLGLPRPASACPPFDPSSTWAVGSKPDGIAAGDVNGDGSPDLVVANWDADEIAVLLGDGHGSFDLPLRTSVGNRPDSLVLADFNGDTHLDVAVVATYGQQVQIFLGDGAGGFVWRQSLTGNSIQAVATGDFDADGRPDLAVVDMYWAPPDPPFGGFVRIYLGNGDGTLRFLGIFTTANFPFAIVGSDFNGDGRPDLAVGSSTGISVLLGTTGGSFAGYTQYAASGLSDLTAGDVNGDSRIDLVTANRVTDDVSILLGKGDGTFGGATRYPAGDGALAVVVADVFGRGLGDVLTADADGDGVSLLSSRGDGSVGPPTTFAAGDEPNVIAIADFDRDGRPDVAVANYLSDNLSVLANANADRPWILFGAHDTITWRPVPGAVSYDVYRGELADLVDADGNGLPDMGYGACLDAVDPDTTDTTFVDAELPPPGSGRYYLASFNGPGSDGIGVTSGCAPRAPAAACP